MDNTIKITAADHPIKSVTVFKFGRAEVVRFFSLPLEVRSRPDCVWKPAHTSICFVQSGQNKVEIRGLSGHLVPDSVRISGLGDARLFDVVSTVASKKPVYDAENEALRTLRAEEKLLKRAKSVREQEAKLLHSYATALNSERVTPVQLTAFLETFVEKNEKNANAVSLALFKG